MIFCCQKCCRWGYFCSREQRWCPCVGILSFCLFLSFEATVRLHGGRAPVVWSDCMFSACMTAYSHVSSGWCQPQGMSDLQLRAHRFPCGLCIDFTQVPEGRVRKKTKTFFFYTLYIYQNLV